MKRSQIRRLITGFALLAPLVSVVQTDSSQPAPIQLWQNSAPGTHRRSTRDAGGVRGMQEGKDKLPVARTFQ